MKVNKQVSKRRVTTEKPQTTKRTVVIEMAVKKAVRDYRKTFELLAAR